MVQKYRILRHRSALVPYPAGRPRGPVDILAVERAGRRAQDCEHVSYFPMQALYACAALRVGGRLAHGVTVRHGVGARELDDVSLSVGVAPRYTSVENGFADLCVEEVCVVYVCVYVCVVLASHISKT